MEVKDKWHYVEREDDGKELKDEPKAVVARVDGVRAFPAYHMNKQHWYTLFLDDRMTDDEIIDLVKISFELVNA